MKCPVCDNQVADNVKFCSVCGTVLAPQAPVSANNFQQNVNPVSNTPNDINFRQNVNPAPKMPAAASFQQNAGTPPNTFGGSAFISKDEHEIARLSNGAVTNLISGEGFKTEGAVLTNKRLYYNHKTGVINVRNQNEMVDVKDITGTKIANYNPIGMLILAALAIVVGIIILIDSGDAEIFIPVIAAALLFVAVYFITKKSHLRIEYAGGAIYFSVKKYGKENVHNFQKSIHAAKESLDSKKN